MNQKNPDTFEAVAVHIDEIRGKKPEKIRNS